MRSCDLSGGSVAGREPSCTPEAAMPHLAVADTVSYRADIAVLRVLAAFAIVVLHVASYGTTKQAYGTLNWWIANGFDASTRWAVPMFVMISGALLLHPHKRMPAGLFYKKRMHRILIPLAFWTVFYLRLRLPFHEMTGPFLARALIRGTPYGHLWYLYMIVGLYFITPFLQACLSNTSRREQSWAVVPLLVAGAVQDGVNTFTADTTPTVFSMFVAYIPYYLCGYLLSQVELPRTSIKYLAAGVLAAWLGIVLGTGLLFQRIGFYLYNHHCPLIILLSIGIFLLASTVFAWQADGRSWPWRALRHLDKVSLGIYLIHPLFIHILKELNLYGLYILRQPLLFIPAISLVVMLASALLASLLRAIPFARRIV